VRRCRNAGAQPFQWTGQAAPAHQNPDRDAVIAGLTNLSLGGTGGAVALLNNLASGIRSTDMASAFHAGSPNTWPEAFAALKSLEAKVKGASQNEAWMKTQRAQWVAFCNNVDCQHPAGFATACLAVEISIKSSAQDTGWLHNFRPAWVNQCRISGAKAFQWNGHFVVSGLDGCEALLAELCQSMKHDAMSSAFTPGDYKTYQEAFAALKQFEAKVKSSCQVADWMTGKRAKWVSFCDNHANHTPTGFATAVLATDVSIQLAHQHPGWGSTRQLWVTRCRNAGAVPFHW